ncbi:MAG: hypothetical protein K2J47_04835 [Ruminococcus sp.]|nr:hypothetical protein [Ruminococcus sp.]
MKIIIKEEIICDYNNIKKYLPSQYASLVDRSFYGKTVTLIFFPDNKRTVTSSNIIKARKKLKNTDIIILYIARCFTIEATKVISESNGVALSLINFLWTDDSYNQIRGGTI